MRFITLMLESTTPLMQIDAFEDALSLLGFALLICGVITIIFRGRR